MGTISNNIAKLKESLNSGITLVAVSKTKPSEAVLEAYNSGQRIFGENKVQELIYKYETLPKDIEWHMIGHLQTNKVKYIAPFVNMIHSVESLKLLSAIDSEALKNKRIISCLLQVKIAREDTKYGLSVSDLELLLNDERLKSMKNIRLAGLMGMATFTDSNEQVRDEFRNLKAIFESIKEKYFRNISYFSEISMGMSDDYRIALEEGSTMIRVGTGIFGEREYSN